MAGAGANLLVLALLLPTPVGWGAAAGGSSLILPAREELERLASTIYPNAVLLKPPATARDDLAGRLAPLIVREQCPSAPADASSTPRAEAAEGLTLFTSEGSLLLEEREHLQVTYLWAVRPLPNDGDRPALQGVRLTLNAAGAPVIWEALSRSDAVRVFFVSESLEAAAQARHGAPLPGRRYSVETGADEHPEVWVVRLLTDGPVPMGPMVYLPEGGGRISTVLCRCMPAQVLNVAETAPYALQPLAGADAIETPGQTAASLRTRLWEWLTELNARSSLAGLLRLPLDF